MGRKPLEPKRNGRSAPSRANDAPGWNGSGYFPQERPAASVRRSEARAHAPVRRSRHINPLRLAALALCLGVCVFCAVQLIQYFGDLGRAASHNQSLSDEYHGLADSAATDAPAPTEAAQNNEVPTAAPTAVAAAVPAATAAPVPAQPATAAPVRASNGRTRLTSYPENPGFVVSERFKRCKSATGISPAG